MVLFIAAALFCSSVKDIVKSAGADFQRVLGDRRVQERIPGYTPMLRTVYTAPHRIEGSTSCMVVEDQTAQALGAPPKLSYACVMSTGASCARDFDALAKELRECFDSNLKVTHDKYGRFAELWHDDIAIDLALNERDPCVVTLGVASEIALHDVSKIPYMRGKGVK
jgi:hypothetical protein